MGIVTKEDYLQEFGVDLDNELVGIVDFDGVDSPTPFFILQIENWCKDYLQYNYSFDGNPSLNPTREKYFKRGVCYQIQYIIHNGSINVESGFNQESNTIISKAELNKLALSQDAYRCFRLGGMANMRSY